MISGPKVNGALGLVLKAMAAWVTAPYLLKQRVPEIDRRHQALDAKVTSIERKVDAIAFSVAFIEGRFKEQDEQGKKSPL